MFLRLVLLTLLPILAIRGSLLLAGLYLRWTGRRSRTILLDTLANTAEERLSLERKITVGFFHPYCNAGGGGERVLWAAVSYLQQAEPNVVSVVYTGDTGVSKTEIINKVKARFSIDICPSSLAIVPLSLRHLVDDKTWRHMTLLGQSLGSVFLAWEAMSRFLPDVFIDTMGYAFTFTLIRWLNPITTLNPLRRNVVSMPIGAYVHYPTISTDMLSRVKNRETGVTNSASITSSGWKTSVKLLYYRAFAFAYSYSLSCADEIVANGTWTKNHIDALLNCWMGHNSSRSEDQPQSVTVVYPPCDTRSLQQLPLGDRKRFILSIAQFRREKNHSAQLRALRSLFQAHPEYRDGPNAVTLVLLGSIRSPDDKVRVKLLQDLAVDLGVHNNIQLVLNATYDELVKWLRCASIGVSSMIDEHFGINVVEMMAAGLIPVVHASGGPLLDIVLPTPEGLPTGFVYASDEYCAIFGTALHVALSMPEPEQLALRARAREAARKFRTEMFEQGFSKFWHALCSKM